MNDYKLILLESEVALEEFKHDIRTKLSIENQATVNVAANIIRGVCKLINDIKPQYTLGTLALALVGYECNVETARSEVKFQDALNSTENP
jgi:DNA-directed RNA polymerase alpha subunit